MTRRVDELYQRGLAAYSEGRWQDAEAALSAVLERRPADAGAVHYRGLVAQSRGRVRRALGLLRRSVAVEPNHARWQFTRPLCNPH
jgi:tetratricopeptide (TPR) repeat protein